MKKKLITIGVIGILLLISFVVVPISSVKSIRISTLHLEHRADKSDTTILLNDLSADLKVRKSGDSGWQESITAKVDTKLEFKIEISSSEGDIMVVIQFPKIDDEIMLTYVIGSASVPPLPLPSDEVKVWAFPEIPPEEITFKAKIEKVGIGSVGLTVGSTENSELVDEDSVQIIGEEKDSIVFHLFTFLNTRRFFFLPLKSTYPLPAMKLIAGNLPTRAIQDF